MGTQIDISRPAGVADIQMAFKYGPEVLHDLAPRYHNTKMATNETCAYMVAHVLQRSVERVRAVNQSGRFVLVEYQPKAQVDPDMIICLDHGTERFHKAILGFQAVRSVAPYDYHNWSSWYKRAKKAASQVLSPLQLLNPTIGEALFVIDWLMNCTTYGKTI